MFPRRLFEPLLTKVTYRRWVYLVLGGAISVPYLLFAAVVIPSLIPVVATTGNAALAGLAISVAVTIGSSFIPAVRVLEGAAVRELLDDPVPGVVFGPVSGWQARARSSLMFLLHVACGCGTSLVSLLIPVGFGFSIAAPFTGRVELSPGTALTVPKGWAGAWVPALFVVGMVVLAYVVWAVGAVLRRCAVALLGLSAADRIAQLERRTGQLAERNRLARELHDSVGHALSVVTIQAGAARRTLRTDPEFTEQALGAIEDSARAALEDLDHVLGLLRDETAGRAPQAGLTELPALLSATRLAGARVDADVRGEDLIAGIPPVVSREAYRILQECLTNALRHAGKVPVTVLVDVTGERLRVQVTNPLGGGSGVAGGGGGGRGLRGMAERVDVLGGTWSAGRVDERWEVAVAVPWGKRK